MYFEEKKFEELDYVVRYPNNYNKNEKYPVIILFHGAGGRGQDINVLKENPFFTITEKIDDFPFVSVGAQCYGNTWFDLFESLEGFVKKIAAESFADCSHIYAMGASMGGYALWQMGMSLPEIFAAIVPICGGGMYWNAARLQNVPVWAFHGEKDDAVLCEESVKMVNAVNRSGGSAKLTIYPDCGHNAWSDTYKNPQVYKWLLSHENQNTKEFIDKFKGSDIYG